LGLENPSMGETILVLGGARSGKTRMAESLTLDGFPVTYIATATVLEGDPEMADRIERHRRHRPQHWTTLEVPRDLESALPPIVKDPGRDALADQPDARHRSRVGA
jgi:adenosylcobinamide kinase/adenosylcobinamide-phosphate guanylyltransferase